MTDRPTTGWSILLCDLSLILFSVVGAASQNSGHDITPPPARGQSASPVAVYRPPASFERWLAVQARDSRMVLTITARGPGDPAGTAATALVLACRAAQRGFGVRVVVEPAAAPDLFATVDYNRPGA